MGLGPLQSALKLARLKWTPASATGAASSSVRHARCPRAGPQECRRHEPSAPGHLLEPPLSGTAREPCLVRAGAGRPTVKCMDPPSSNTLGSVRDAGSGLQRLRDRVMSRTHPLSVTYWPPRCFACIMVKGFSSPSREQRPCLFANHATTAPRRAAWSHHVPADGATAAGY